MYKKILLLLFIGVITIPSIYPLLQPGFFNMHDDTQVARVSQMTKAFADGQFPVRWVADLGYGYGYPLFNFYGPFPYYVGLIGMLSGLSPLVATKIMFIIGIIGAAFSMYFLAKEIWGTLPAVLSAALYQYAPYHAVDIYVRGAVSEFWAIAILPFLFLGFVKLHKKKVPENNLAKEYMPLFLLISISYALLIITHNITALMTTLLLVLFAPIVGVIMIQQYRKKQKLDKNTLQKLTVLCISLVAGLGFTVFYWFPALTQTSYTNVESVIGGGADYRDHYVTMNQLWDSTWGFGGSTKGEADGLSFKVGKIHVVLSAFSLILLLWQIYAKTANKRLITYSFCLLGIIVVSVFMTHEASRPAWTLVPILAYVQYPWRFLVFIIFGVSLLAGGLFTIKKDFFVIALSLLTLFVVIYINQKYFVPQHYTNLSNSEYESDEYIKWSVSQRSDEYMPRGFRKPLTEEDIVLNKIEPNPNLSISSEVYKTHRYDIRFNAQSDANIHINTAFFPGWEAWVDSEKVTIDVYQDGMGVRVPKDSHQLVLQRNRTLLEKTADSISLFSLVAVFGTMMRLRYPTYAHKTKR